MPTMLENAKEATYTALGLNVLILDEVNDRFAGPRKQVVQHLNIARDHAKKAQAEWQKQADDVSANVKERLPFDLTEVTDSVQNRVQPVALRTFEAAEPTMTRFSEMAPAPFDNYITDGVTKVRELLVDQPVVKAKTAPVKKAAARKPAAKKTAARKPAAKKAATKR